MSSRAITSVILVLLTFLGGCFASKAPLGPAEHGVINRELLGTWRCQDPGKEKNATLLVMKYDSSRYYLEWREKDETSRWAAHSSIAGGALLHNVRELKANGSDSESWVFMRALTPTDSQLLLAVVKDDDLKKLSEQEAHREIRRRVKDESLYAPYASCQRVVSPQ